MSNIVLNIPHSCTVIPKWAMKDIMISNEGLAFLADFMADRDVDRLWDFVPVQNKQVAALSRIIVDTERYRNDADETMYTKGMGLYYTHTPEGKQFRLRSEDIYTKCLDIYDTYHSSLEEKVADKLEKYRRCIILDCHSFHDKMNYTGFVPDFFPDVCIGVNGELTAEARIILDIFKTKGYSVKVNEPFAGSLLPIKYMNDNRVSSVMIELNRRIYDNSSFGVVQSICKEIYDNLFAGAFCR